MRVFITGSTGCLGRRLVYRLVEVGHEVVALVRNAEVDLELPERNSTGKLEKFLYDLEEGGDEGYLDPVDVFVHCAAITPGQGRDFSKNRKMTLRALDLALRRGTAHFIHISSCSVMGDLYDGCRDDSFEVNPDSAYGWSKLECEQEVIRHCKREGIPYTILRPGLIYGPDDRGTILKMIRMVDRGYFIRLGSGENRKSMTSVENLCRVILSGLKNHRIYGDALIVVDSQSYTLNEIVRQIGALLGRDPKFMTVPDWLCRWMIQILVVFGKAHLPLPVSAMDLRKLRSSNFYSPVRLQQKLGDVLEDEFQRTLSQEVHWYLGKIKSKPGDLPTKRMLA